MNEQPNIVWVTMESTRHDHTTLGGHFRETTPNLKQIADSSRGQSFDLCFSHGIWTLPSSASILTGTFPSRHGAGMDNDRIPEGLRTIPESLSAAGYHTACLSPNSHISSATGLDRGFDEFAWISRSNILEVAGIPTVLKYLLNIRRHGGGLTTDTSKHGSGFILHDLAKQWLTSYAGDDEPFFIYAHYGDPHHPYYPPLPYLREFAQDLDMSPSEAGELALRHHAELNERIANGCEFTPEEWAAIRALYDGCIAYTDELVGDLFQFVESLDLKDTIFIVTADHGELFGEHGMLAHKVVVDDAVCHVPLVVHGMDSVDDNIEMIQHADLMRTLVSEAGGDTDQIQGRDLRCDSREFAIIQRGANRYQKNVDRFKELNPAFETSGYHEGTLHALRTDQYKYLASKSGNELFELPDEETDVSDNHPELAESFEQRLRDWLEREGDPIAGEKLAADFSKDMEQQLEDLGYL